MSIPARLDTLRLPVIASPMFIVSGPELLIAQSMSGVVGSLPSLNARSHAQLDEWLHQIETELAAHDRRHPESPAAPFAVNLIVHRSNDRLDRDLQTVTEHRVPIVITSLGARAEVNEVVHSYGGITLHDVTTDAYARKAIATGADGLIAVAAGAGGHAGTLSPFALLQEIRHWFDGTLVLSGAIATGRSILAANAAGADLAYIGSAFIATTEARAVGAYKQMLVDSTSADIVYTSQFSGVAANYLAGSIRSAGFDPAALKTGTPDSMDFGTVTERTAKGPRPWRDIWGAGHGVGSITSVLSVAELIDRLDSEYQNALRSLVSRH